jgi:tetratricopeptide (TPR) repeat protein
MAEPGPDAEAPPESAAESEAEAPAAPAWDDEDLSEAISVWTQEDGEEEEAPVSAPAGPPPVLPSDDDDFDAVLAALTPIAEPSGAAPAAAPPAPAETPAPEPPPAPASPPVAERMAEAESLLAALSAQTAARPEAPAPVAAPPAAPVWPAHPLPVPPAGEAPLPEDEGLDAEADPAGDAGFDYGAITGRRHYGRHFARRSRRARRMLLGLGVAVVLVLAGLAGYRGLVRPAVLGPEQLLRAAGRAVAEGQHEAAGRYYQQFADRFPGHPLRPEALFDAGFYFQLPDAGAATATPARRNTAIALLERFALEYPSDPRSARARALMGVLHADLGNHEQAVELLRAPARQVDDPVAALPVLRKLASSYRMRNLYRDAESTYLQAATLPKNFTPDADYYALGDMLQAEAALATDPAERSALRARALEYWTRAAGSAGIDPVEREKIENQMKWLQTQQDDEGGAAGAPDGAAPAPGTDAAAPAPPPMPETDAAAEAAFIEQNIAPAATPGGE